MAVYEWLYRLYCQSIESKTAWGTLRYPVALTALLWTPVLALAVLARL